MNERDLLAIMSAIIFSADGERAKSGNEWKVKDAVKAARRLLDEIGPEPRYSVTSESLEQKPTRRPKASRDPVHDCYTCPQCHNSYLVGREVRLDPNLNPYYVPIADPGCPECKASQ